MFLKKNITDANKEKKITFNEEDTDYKYIIDTIDSIDLSKQESSVKKSKKKSVYTSPPIINIEVKDNIGDFNEVSLLDDVIKEDDVFKKCNIHSILKSDDINEKLKYYSIYNNVNDVFSQIGVKFRITMPIYIRDDWIKESANLKRCYLIIDKDTYKPKIYTPSSLKKSIILNKNGPINDSISNNEECLNMLVKYYSDSITLYNNLLYNNVDISVAISILPQSTYVEFIESGSLYDYYRLFKRFKNNTKSVELRNYIIKIIEILKKKYPISWNYLTDN